MKNNAELQKMVQDAIKWEPFQMPFRRRLV